MLAMSVYLLYFELLGVLDVLELLDFSFGLLDFLLEFGQIVLFSLLFCVGYFFVVK